MYFFFRLFSPILYLGTTIYTDIESIQNSGGEKQKPEIVLNFLSFFVQCFLGFLKTCIFSFFVPPQKPPRGFCSFLFSLVCFSEFVLKTFLGGILKHPKVIEIFPVSFFFSKKKIRGLFFF